MTNANENVKSIIDRDEIINLILDYFKENEDVFNDCIEELDSYNGYLGDDRYYEMEWINEFYSNTDPLELLNRAYFGYDEDSYTIDQYGQRRHDEFNPNRDFFRYNGYGNLVSADYKDYSAYMDHYAIEEMQEHRGDIYTLENNSELSELFDALEEAEEE